MTLCGFNWHAITTRGPYFYFHHARGCLWRDCNMESQWFHFHLFFNINMWSWSCWEASCQLVWGCKGGGGLTGNSLSNIKWVTCVFLFKNVKVSRAHGSVQRQRHPPCVCGGAVGPWGPCTCTGLAVCWRCKREGQRPLAKDTSSDNPFCAVCCFHLLGCPTKIRLLHLKQNSWNLLRVE